MARRPGGSLLFAAAAAAAAPPHLIFVVVDDLGAGDVGYRRPSGDLDLARRSWWCYGRQENDASGPTLPKSAETALARPRVGSAPRRYADPELAAATPQIDRLAREGIVLDRFYVSPTCTASRAALLTGRHPLRLGLRDSVVHATEPRAAPLDTPHLAETLRASGYATVFLGKWHLGFHQAAYTPRRRGYDEFFGILTGGRRPARSFDAGRLDAAAPTRVGGRTRGRVVSARERPARDATGERRVRPPRRARRGRWVRR